ncbi:MAG TPA: hypothetical protein VN784_17370 [Candidatus Limnocylindrales bacterium]|nr:hypothetical protein [Candidatus Limnocylindrales bacterium]
MKTLKSIPVIRVTPCKKRGAVAKRVLLITVVMTLLAGNGCVNFNDESEPPSWPKPVSATDTTQFDGIFKNQNVNATTYRSGIPITDLFDFISGRRTANGMRGSQVEIRTSKDGSALDVRLLDGQGSEIAATNLHRGSDFDLSSGALALYGPFSGNHGSSGNLGTGVEHHSARLYVSSTHDLLGTQSSSNVGLLFYCVPMAMGGKDWILWPRVSQEERIHPL